MSNFVFIARVSAWNREGKTHDIKGARNVVIEPIAGVSPRGLNVVAGTVANTIGLEIGKNYLFSAMETSPYYNEETDEKVRQFTFKQFGELSPREIMEMISSGATSELQILISAKKKQEEKVEKDDEVPF